MSSVSNFVLLVTLDQSDLGLTETLEVRDATRDEYIALTRF